MRNYDLLLLDIDGTLVGPDHMTISPRNRQALQAAKEAGVLLAIATGRCLRILPEQALDAGFDYAITSNGAAIDDLRTGRRLYYNALSAQKAAVAYKILEPAVDFVEWFADGEILLSRRAYALIGTHELPPWHTRYLSQGGTPVVESEEAYIAAGAPGLEKIAVIRYPRETISLIHRQLDQTGLFSLTSSIGRSLEIMTNDCTKGNGALILCRLLGLDPHRTAACGDGDNDISLLQAVGCGCAMGNAGEDVKAAAACVCAPNDQDGVAEFIWNKVL